LAGAVNGLFGSGGGLLLVPFYTDVIKLEQRRAFATSVFSVLILSVVSIITYNGKVSIDIMSILPFLLGGAIGGIAGATILKRLPVNIIRKVFALFFYGRHLRHYFYESSINIVMSLLSGALSGIGIGGGAILLVFMSVFLNMPQLKAQYINLLYFIPTAIAALIIHRKI
jgi:uncharacterized membrane protein YfcA